MRSADVKLEVNLREYARLSQSADRAAHAVFFNPEETSSEFQKQGASVTPDNGHVSTKLKRVTKSTKN